MSAARTLAAVRVRAVHARPYFATALFALQMVQRPGLDTMMTDQWGRVYIDPTIIGPGKKWSVQQAAGVLIHELAHWLRKHHERGIEQMKAAKGLVEAVVLKEKINTCEDMEINDDLIDDFAMHGRVNLSLPPNMPDGSVLCPGSFGLPNGQLWEYYYQQLKDGSNAEFEAFIGSPTIVIDCGSSAHGVPGDYELPPPGSSGVGIRDAEGDLIRRQVAREIKEHSRSIGRVPGGWQRWADEILAPPRVPWERELAALVRNAFTMAMGMVDYSWSKPSRRGNFNGVVMPRLRRPVPEVAVVIDTSASMSKDDITAACSEVDGICKALGQRQVRAIACDAEAYDVQIISRGKDLDLEGGGGTDMGVGIDKAKELGVDVIIVLTDGGTPWPDAPPAGSEVVICLINAAEEDMGAPPWAKRVVEVWSDDE